MEKSLALKRYLLQRKQPNHFVYKLQYNDSFIMTVQHAVQTSSDVPQGIPPVYQQHPSVTIGLTVQTFRMNQPTAVSGIFISLIIVSKLNVPGLDFQHDVTERVTGFKLICIYINNKRSK